MPSQASGRKTQQKRPSEPSVPKVRKRTKQTPLPLDDSDIQIASESTLVTDPFTPGLNDLRLIPSEQTPVLTAWRKALPSLRITKRVRPTKMDNDVLIPLSDMDDMPGRDYMSRVEKDIVPINWDPKQNNDGAKFSPSAYSKKDLGNVMEKWSQDITVYRVFVWNAKRYLRKDDQSILSSSRRLLNLQHYPPRIFQALDSGSSAEEVRRTLRSVKTKQSPTRLQQRLVD